MKLITVQDDVELISNVNTWLRTSLQSSDSNQKIVQLPAGNTPLSLYKSWESERPDFLDDVTFQQVDDVLTGPKSSCFKLFFKEHLPSYQQQFLPLSDSPVKPNIVILGVGANGHLAFHEPEINFNFNYGCVLLSPTTCKNLNLIEPTWGISYGVGHFMQCHSVLIIVKGENKKAIVQQALTEKTPTTPFSYVLKHHLGCKVLFLETVRI